MSAPGPGHTSSGWIIYRRQDEHSQVEIRIQRRAPWLVLLLLIALQIAFPARVWVVLLAGLGAALALTCLWVWRTARGVSLERRLLHTSVQVGDLLEESAVLHNHSAFPVPGVEILDQSDVPGYAFSSLRSAPGQWRQQGHSTRRGLFHLGPTTLRWSDPLGLFTISHVYRDSREVLVYPPILHNLAGESLRGGGVGERLAALRSLQETAALDSLRDYQAGDPIRRIHWPLSARHGRFLVKEFARETGGNVWLLPDLDAAVHGGEDESSSLEDLVILAASWAWYLLRRGRGVGLFLYGPQRICLAPARGTAQLWQILRILAAVELQAERPCAALLDESFSRFQAGDALVVLTPSAQAAWAERLVHAGPPSVARCAVLLETEASGNASLALSAWLAGHGIASQVTAGRLGVHAAPAAPGSGDWDFILTPFGKAVLRSRPAEAHS